MTVGVHVLADDVRLLELVTDAIERSDDAYVATSAEQAHVVLAQPSLLPRARGSAAIVVLATGSPIAAARAAMDAGADGIVCWPDDEQVLGLRLAEAAGRRVAEERGPGRVIAVVAARGGAGATVIAAHLAATLAPDALLLDLRGGPAGQALFATQPASVTLTSAPGVLTQPSAESLRRAATTHAAGVSCVLGGDAPPAPPPGLSAALRHGAAFTIVDGFVEDADVTLLVIAADVGSVRGAVALALHLPGRAEIALNRWTRGRVRPRDVQRAMGRKPAVVIPDDARLARAADLGRVARRGPGARAIARLARTASANKPANERKNEPANEPKDQSAETESSPWGP